MWLPFLAFHACVGDFVVHHEIGLLRIDVAARSRRVSLHRPFAIQVTVQASSAVQATPPDFRVGEAFGDAALLAVRIDGPDAVEGPFGRLNLQNWRLEIEPLRAGELALPTLSATYRENRGPVVNAIIPLPSFQVVDDDAEPAPQELRLPPPESAEHAPNVQTQWARRLKWAGAFLALGVAAAYGISLRMRPRSAAVAVRRIGEAVRDGGDGRRTLAAINEALRAYLRSAYGTFAMGATNPELSSSAMLVERATERNRTLLAEAFDAVDLSRFAEHEPSAADVESAKDRAFRFLLAESERR